MAEELIILRRKGNSVNENIELFIGNSNESKVFEIDMDKQLEWIQLIADNIRDCKRKNV